MNHQECPREGTPDAPPAVAQLERWLDAGAALRLQPWLDDLLASPDVDMQLLALRALGHLGGERQREARTLRLGRQHPSHDGAQVALLRTVLGNRGEYAYWRAASRRPLPEAQGVRAERLSLDALWLARLRDESSALRTLKEARRLRPDDPWIWTETSYALSRLDRRAEARESCEEALRLWPGFRTALQQLAELALHDERPQRVRELLEPVLANTGNAYVAWQLHALAADEGRHADALQLLDAAERGSPRAQAGMAATLAARRADAHLALGELAQAQSQAQKVPGQGFCSRLAERLKAVLAEPGSAPRRRLLELPRITQHWMTCAPATLAALARFWGRPAEHLEIAQAICYDGTPYPAQRQWALTQGFEVHEFKLDWATSIALIDAGMPFALGTQHVGGGHLQAVVGYDALRGTLLIRDPGQALHAEYDATLLFDGQQSSGPRALLLLPPEAAPRLQGIELPERAAWNEVHALQAALQRHDRDGALQALARLAQVDPDGDCLLRAQRGLAIYDGDEPRILAATEALLARYPEDGDLHLSRVASLYEVQGQAAGDAALAARAARPWADALVLARWSARVAADGRRLPEAQALARRALRRDGTQGRAWSELGDRLWASAGVASALAPLRWASTLMPTEEWAAAAYARGCRVAGRADEGLAWLQERAQTWGGRSSAPALTWADELDALQRQPEADALLAQTLAARPQDASLRLALAERRLRQQRLDEADALLAGCEDAHAPGLLRLRALLLEARGQLADALAAVREAVSLEPLNLAHHRLLLRLLRRQMGPVAALAAWRPLADAHPAHFSLQRLLYEALTDEPGPTNAQLAHLNATHPNNAWLQRERAIQASRQSRLEEAVVLAKAACALAPESPAGHDVLAYCLIRDQGFAAAVPALHAALRCDAEYEPAMQRLLRNAPDPESQRAAADFIADELRRQPLLGDGLLGFQDEVRSWDPEAVLTFLQGLASHWPSLWQGPVAVARQLRALQRTDEALQQLREAVTRFPELPRVHLELAEALRQAGDGEGALQANARTLALSPSWNAAVRLQVDLLGDHGRRWDEAADVIRHALSQRDGFDDADLIGLLAWVGEQQGGRDAEVLAQARQSLQLNPRPSWVWNLARRVCERSERWTEFDALVADVLASRPGDADAWAVQARHGRDDVQALAAAERALALEPLHESAWLARFERLQRLGRGDEIPGLLAQLPWPGAAPLSLREWGPRQQWAAGQRQEALVALRRLRAEAAPQDEDLCGLQADWEDELDEHAAYLATAQALLVIAPLSARSHNYVGHALLKAGRPKDALAPLQQALTLSPGYAFAATQLVEAARQAQRPDLAETALQALWPHRTNVLTASMGLEQAASARDNVSAEVWLQRLFALDEYEIPRCGEALKAWRAAGPDWAQRLLTLQRAHVRQGGGPVGVTLDWLNQREGRSFWLALVEAWRWQREGEARAAQGQEVMGPHLLRALLRWLLDNDARLSLKLLIRRFEPALRADPSAWGEVSYVLHRMDAYSAVRRWLHDWPSQPRAPAFALANLAGALGVLGRWDEMRTLVDKGLARFPYQEDLRLWQLLLHARDGDRDALRDGLAHTQEWTPDAWMQPLIEALRAASCALDGARLTPAQRAALRVPSAQLPRVGQALIGALRRSLWRHSRWARWLGLAA
jgi:predicted Zn-dependent protease